VVMIEPAAAMPVRSKWSGKALFAVAIWGASFVATRIALQSFTPMGLVALRLLAAVVVLSLAAAAMKKQLFARRKDLPICFFLGGVLALHQYIQAEGLTTTSAINAGWIIGFAPIPIALGGQFFLKQKLSARGWMGIGMATSGIAFIITSTTPGFLNARTGDLLQVLSSFTWAAYTLAGIKVVARNGPLAVIIPATLAGSVMLVGAASVTGFMHAGINARSLMAALFLGLICSGAGYYIWYRVLDEYGAARAGSYLYIEPFVTVAVAAALLNEPITMPVVAGGLLVLLGVWRVGSAPGSPARSK
jgi:drug/metabolite transporter (DMT)-like permease